jgi:transaldolase
MQEAGLLERLAAASPGMEIWWDSTPLVFDAWCARMLAKARPADRPVLRRQFARMFNDDDPASQLFRGVTTNPIYSMHAIAEDKAAWQSFAFDVIAEEADIDSEGLFWRLYKEIIRRSSDRLLPLFHATSCQEGYLSAQIDARCSFDKQAMVSQAMDLAAINPNIMIKIPGTSAGYEAIEQLTSLGVSTNNTTTFVLSQLMDCAKAVERGLKTARAAGVDLSHWRSVITHMLARFGDLGGLKELGAERGIELTDADVRLAEMAVFKKAYRLLSEGGYESKLLACSFKMGPEVGGAMTICHLEEMAGGSVIPTVPPIFIEAILASDDADAIVFDKGAISRDVPKAVIDKLLRIPYFERGYAQDGYSASDYDTLPPVVKTVEEFSGFNEQMAQFAGECLALYAAR